VSSASIASWETTLYARASSVDAPSGSRIATASSAFARASVAVAHDPVKPRQRQGGTAPRLLVAQLSVDRDRPFDRREGVVEPTDGVRSTRELFEDGCLVGRSLTTDEHGGASVVGVRLPIRVQRRSSPRGDQCVLGDHGLGARGLRMVDDVCRVGVRGEQGLEDLGVEAAPRSDRDAGSDRVPGQLVAETNVRRVDLEQLPALRFLRRGSPAGHHRVQQGGAHAGRDNRDELHQAACGLLEPRRTSQNRVRDRRRQAACGSRGQELGDVERVASGRRVHLVGIVAGERSDGARRQGRQLEKHRVVGADSADRCAKRMSRRDLASPKGQHEERRQRADPPSEHGDRVERCTVRPVHVLDHEHRRPGRMLQLRDQQRLDLVRRRAGGERLVERRRDAPDEVPNRAERPRNRQVVARAEQHPRTRVQIPYEPGDERGLPDPRLPGDQDETTVAARGRLARLGESGQCTIALEELHRSKIDLVPASKIASGSIPRKLSLSASAVRLGGDQAPTKEEAR
jgi:hypothetical protein